MNLIKKKLKEKKKAASKLAHNEVLNCDSQLKLVHNSSKFIRSQTYIVHHPTCMWSLFPQGRRRAN
jgi:hypothetical protein